MMETQLDDSSHKCGVRNVWTNRSKVRKNPDPWHDVLIPGLDSKVRPTLPSKNSFRPVAFRDQTGNQSDNQVPLLAPQNEQPFTQPDEDEPIPAGEFDKERDEAEIAELFAPSDHEEEFYVSMERYAYNTYASNRREDFGCYTWRPNMTENPTFLEFGYDDVLSAHFSAQIDSFTVHRPMILSENQKLGWKEVTLSLIHI